MLDPSGFVYRNEIRDHVGGEGGEGGEVGGDIRAEERGGDNDE